MGAPVPLNDLPTSNIVPAYDLPAAPVSNPQPQNTSWLNSFSQGAGNLAAGAMRGAGSIGSTALSLAQYAGLPQLAAKGLDALAGQGDSTASNVAHSVADSLRLAGADRRQAMDQGLQTMGAEPNSLLYKTGKIGAEIAGTAGVGGALANGLAKVAPQAMPLINALRTGGFTLGEPAGATLGAQAAQMGTRMLGGAAAGGASAAMINPEDAEMGALVGGAMPPAAQLAGELGKGAKAALYDPIFNQNKILSNALLSAVGRSNVNDVLSAIKTKAQTPGVNFSAGTSSMNPAIAAIEDSLRAKNPAGALNLQQTANNSALVAPMRNLAQDSASVDAAELARTQATNPLYTQAANSDALADPSRVVNLIDRIITKQPANDVLVSSLNRIRNGLFQPYEAADRAKDALASLQQVAGTRMSGVDADAVRQASTIMRRVRMGTVSTDDAVQAINGLSTSGKTAGDALDLAAQYMKTPDYVLRQNPGELMSAMDNIKGMLGNQENAHIRDELNTIKNVLGHQISKAAPEFGQANQLFAEMSGPINQMKVGQLLTNKLIPAGSGDIPTRLNASSFAQALRNPDQVAKQATGFKRANFDRIMTPDQSAMINDVSSDASRIAEAKQLGMGYGSATDRRRVIGDFLQNNLHDTAPMMTALMSVAGEIPGLGYATKLVGGAGQMIGGGINKHMATTLENMLANDPQAIANALQGAYKSSIPMNPALVNLLRAAPIALSAQ